MVGKNLRILIVEDDQLLSFVEERMVKKLGHVMAGKASSGAEAVQKVKEVDPDLIMMDICLGGSPDGIEAMQQVREFSSTPVVFLTGDDQVERREKANKISRCVDFLVKPVQLDDLRSPLARVQQLLRNQTDPGLAGAG